MSSHPDCEFFAATADQLREGRLDASEIEQIDKLLDGYSVAVRIYLEHHGRRMSQHVEARRAA